MSPIRWESLEETLLGKRESEKIVGWNFGRKLMKSFMHGTSPRVSKSLDSGIWA
jgi:hypothetical protein